MVKKKDKYRLLIENLPDGLAYCKMVLDSTGKPVDYIFLEVNSSFEALTGLPRDHIIGKKLTEVSPEIEDLSLDWIDVFDQVAAIAIGQRIHFQQYLDQQDRWYEVTAYSDQPGYFAAVFHNITEHKQVEEKLFETKEYLKKLIKYASVPIIVWDTSLSITRFNQAFENLSGYQASEVIGKKIDLLFSKNKIESALEHIQKTSSGERWEAIEIEIKRKDGEPRIVLWNSANILGAERSNVIATIAQGQDITQRKQAEEALRENQVNLTALVENTEDRIWAVDADYRLIISNIKFLQGVKEELKSEIALGESVLPNSLPQAVQDEWRSYYDRALLGESFRVEKEMQFYKEPAFIDYRFHPIRFVEEKISGVVVSGRNITERKQAEEALRTSEAGYRLLVENANEVILVAQDGMLKFVNRMAVELMGY
jgi:PAS domain S-box-containing protein